VTDPAAFEPPAGATPEAPRPPAGKMTDEQRAESIRQWNRQAVERAGTAKSAVVPDDAPAPQSPPRAPKPTAADKLRTLLEKNQGAKAIPKEDRSTVEVLRNIVSSQSRAGKIPGERHYPVEPDVAFKQYLSELPKSAGATAAQTKKALKSLTVGVLKGADVGPLIYRARAAGVPDETIMRVVGVGRGKAPASPAAPAAARVPASDADLEDLLRQSVDRGP
jgi:hypothetical protein